MKCDYIYKATIAYAKEEGEAIGREEGVAIGKKEGFEPALVARITKLPKKQVMALR